MVTHHSKGCPCHGITGILVNMALGDLVDYMSTTHVGWPREAWPCYTERLRIDFRRFGRALKYYYFLIRFFG